MNIFMRIKEAYYKKTPINTLSKYYLFDSQWYLERYGASFSGDRDPFRHYRSIGWRKGYNPNPLFDVAYYLENNPDVERSGKDPLLHYQYYGWKEGRNPSKFFNVNWYLSNNNNVRLLNGDPLYHYLRFGWKEGLLPTSHFSAAEYLKYYQLKGLDFNHPFINALYRQSTDEKVSGNPVDEIDQSGKTMNALHFIQSEITKVYTKATDLPDYEDEIEPNLSNPPVKLIAFYLPQFHTIPENDAWWGKGFTEWTNVAKARPLFDGHYQPRLPGALGYYDLRNTNIIYEQVKLAKKYGIHGFCFHHYWFDGKELLEAPIKSFLQEKDFDINFCLSWANESWTRRWDGNETQILINQGYGSNYEMKYIKSIEESLLDPRYIKIDNKPVLIVYKPDQLPYPRRAKEIWNEYCQRIGFNGIYLIGAQTWEFRDPRKYDFDAAVEFPPHKNNPRLQNYNQPDFFINFEGKCWDYEQLAANFSAANENYLLYKTVSPSWDNTARLGTKATIFNCSTPQKYKSWLYDACSATIKKNLPKHHIIFINAWNEWAEGAYLEPDRKFGYAYLNATADILMRLDKEHG